MVSRRQFGSGGSSLAAIISDKITTLRLHFADLRRVCLSRDRSTNTDYDSFPIPYLKDLLDWIKAKDICRIFNKCWHSTALLSR